MNEDLIDRMAEAFYEKGREQFDRTEKNFGYYNLSETYRGFLRERMRAALGVQESENNY